MQADLQGGGVFRNNRCERRGSRSWWGVRLKCSASFTSLMPSWHSGGYVAIRAVPKCCSGFSSCPYQTLAVGLGSSASASSGYIPGVGGGWRFCLPHEGTFSLKLTDEDDEQGHEDTSCSGGRFSGDRRALFPVHFSGSTHPPCRTEGGHSECSLSWKMCCAHAALFSTLPTPVAV